MILSIILCLLGCTSAEAGNSKKPVFKTAQDCAKSTLCYCSEKGDYRKREASDTPIFVPNDPYGKYCYCKQWDLDNAPVATQEAINKRNMTRSRPRGPKD